MNKKLLVGLNRFSGLYLWAVFVVLFGILAPQQFLTVTTARIIASQQSVSALVALALLIPMVVGEFDLSVGVNANLGGLIATTLMTNLHMPVIVAVLLSVLSGTVVGLVNGFVVVELRVSSFIATLGMSSVLLALMTIVTSGLTPMPYVDPFWTNLTQAKVLGFQVVVLYLLVAAVAIWWVLAQTPTGRRMYATGSNLDAARLSGIRTQRLSWGALAASGGVSSLAGVLYTSLTGPSLTFGQTLILPAFAAVFLGATQVLPGRFNVWGTLLAIGVLATGVSGLELVTGLQWIKNLFDGVALIVAVALSVSQQRGKVSGGRQRRRELRRAGKGDSGDRAPAVDVEAGTPS